MFEAGEKEKDASLMLPTPFWRPSVLRASLLVIAEARPIDILAEGSGICQAWGI
jgi:lipid-A-disaccharide synthase-like uncharacterized protein